jgi:S1-C subfamily serine protease
MKLILLINTIIIMILSTSYLQDRDYAKVSAKHIVQIHTMTGMGTGFYIRYKAKTYLVTNAHVCGHSNVIKTVDGMHKVLKLSDKVDLCLIENTREHGLPLAYTALQSLDKVIVTGYPLGQPITSRIGRAVGMYQGYYLISVAIFGGNSGSPVLNEDGRVTGVISVGNVETNEDAGIVTREQLIVFLEANR